MRSVRIFPNHAMILKVCLSLAILLLMVSRSYAYAGFSRSYDLPCAFLQGSTARKRRILTHISGIEVEKGRPEKGIKPTPKTFHGKFGPVHHRTRDSRLRPKRNPRRQEPPRQDRPGNGGKGPV